MPLQQVCLTAGHVPETNDMIAARGDGNASVRGTEGHAGDSAFRVNDAFPLLLAALSLGAGLAIERLSGVRLPAVLVVSTEVRLAPELYLPLRNLAAGTTVSWDNASSFAFSKGSKALMVRKARAGAGPAAAPAGLPVT